MALNLNAGRSNFRPTNFMGKAAQFMGMRDMVEQQTKRRTMQDLAKSSVDPKTGQMDQKRFISSVMRVYPQEGMKLQQAMAQQAQMASQTEQNKRYKEAQIKNLGKKTGNIGKGGKTQPPAAQVFVGNDGKPYQLSRVQGNAVMMPYTMSAGGKVPTKFQPAKPGQPMTDIEGNEFVLPPGSNVAQPVKTPGGEQIVDPAVKFKKEELVLKKQEEERAAKKDLEEVRKRFEKHKTIKIKKESELESINEFIDLASSISASPDLGGVTGMWGFGKLLPGSDWADINTDLERLLSMGAIETMAKLKRESPTGSTGFGALSEKELSIIQNSFASLKSDKQSPEKLKKELARIVNVMTEYTERLNKYESEMQSQLKTERKSLMERYPMPK